MWQSFTVIGRGISEITRWKKKKHHEHFISPPVTPYGRPNEVGKAHCNCMLAFFKWRIKRNRASVASEKIFEQMIGWLYKANTCLSNLIFLPLIFPQILWKYARFSFPVFFPERRLSLCFYGVDAPANRRGIFGDGRPCIVLETPNPDFRYCKL